MHSRAVRNTVGLRGSLATAIGVSAYLGTRTTVLPTGVTSGATRRSNHCRTDLRETKQVLRRNFVVGVALRRIGIA